MAFRDIVGQKKTIDFLQNSIKQDKVASAYLFTGPESVGKFLAAKNFAKALNCLSPVGWDCCDKCSSCIKIDSNNHPDVLIIAPQDKSRQIKIDEIRRLRDQINLRPYEAKKKVYIINNSHLMNAEASNCLLKTLEEPPLDSVLILITPSLNQLFSTIISRCQIIRFLYLGEEEIKDILTLQYKKTAAEAQYLARLAGGSLAEVVSVTDENVLEHKNKVLDEFINAPWQFLSGVSGYEKEKIQQDLKILLSLIRDILIFRITQKDTLVANIDRIKYIKSLSDRVDEKELTESLEKVQYAQRLLASNLNIDARLILRNLSGDIAFILEELKQYA